MSLKSIGWVFSFLESTKRKICSSSSRCLDSFGDILSFFLIPNSCATETPKASAIRWTVSKRGLSDSLEKNLVYSALR